MCVCVPTAGCTCPPGGVTVLGVHTRADEPQWLQVPPRSAQQTPGSCPQAWGCVRHLLWSLLSRMCWVTVRGFSLPSLPIRSEVSAPFLPELVTLCPVCEQRAPPGTSACASSLTPVLLGSLLVSSCLQISGLQWH